MEKQEQNQQDNVSEKTGFAMIYYLKSLIKNLLIICVLAGGAYWVYLHPNIFDNIKLFNRENKAKEDVLVMQINQLQSQMAVLQSQILNQPTVDLSVFEDKVASLEKQSLNVIDSKADVAVVLGMLTRVDKLENRLDKLAKISDDGALILSATMLVKQAAEEGNNFVYEAEILNQLSEKDSQIRKDVSVIAEYARNGIVSKQELIRKFNDIYAKAQSEDKLEAKDWKERLNYKINEYIKINKIGENAPKLVAMQKMEEIMNLVNEGKIAKAIKLIESSDSGVISQNQLLQEWLVDAKNMISFNSAIRNIAAYCLAEMKVHNLKNKE